MTTILLCLYFGGVGAFGWNYVQNGVFLAYDERPVWLATLETIGWPISIQVRFIQHALEESRSRKKSK